jgi:hypothetical protein
MLEGLSSWLEGRDVSKLRAVAAGGRVTPSGSLSFEKITLADGLCDLRGNHFG